MNPIDIFAFYHDLHLHMQVSRGQVVIVQPKALSHSWYPPGKVMHTKTHYQEACCIKLSEVQTFEMKSGEESVCCCGAIFKLSVRRQHRHIRQTRMLIIHLSSPLIQKNACQTLYAGHFFMLPFICHQSCQKLQGNLCPMADGTKVVTRS